MNCRYCGASNPEDEHRCGRCGRRLRPNVPVPNRTATAPVLDPVVEEPAAQSSEQSAERHQPTFPPRQKYLFAEAAPRVIPFDSIAPSNPKPAPQFSKTPEMAPERRPRPAAPRRRAQRVVSDAQPAFDFLPPAPPAHAARRNVAESAIYCDAPVATLSQRFVAAALDVSIVFAGFILMMSVFAYKTGGIVLTGYAPAIYGAMFGLLFLFYKYVSYRFAEVSPGVRWAGLCLLDFDGRQPAVRSRLHRLAAGCLSLLPAGAGLLWALVDEEHLTWHDQMSKTFLTPAVPRRS